MSKKQKQQAKKGASNSTIVSTAVATTITAKTIAIFAVLGVVLVGLIVGLVLAIVFLREPEEESRFDIWEGEMAFGNAAHLAYPLIENEEVTKIDIKNESGSYSFVSVWDEDLAKYDWRIDSCDDVALNKTSFEMLRMHLCTATTKDPIRNASRKDLEDCGVDESCKSVYTLYYEKDGKENSYTVRIGNRTNSSDGTYYAYIEGRNHIYKFAGDMTNYTNQSLLYYLSPSINSFFANETHALLGIDRFQIYSAKDDAIKSIVKIVATERDETKATVTFNAIYPTDDSGRDKTTVASTLHLTDVFSTLYLTFLGNEVVALSPTDDELEKFGLSDSDEKYLLSVDFATTASFVNSSAKQNEPELLISKKIEDSYYILSKYFDKDIIVKISSETLSFLGEDPYSLIKWTDTNSITSGFYESITYDASRGEPGVNKIVIKASKDDSAQTFNEETFILNYNEKTEFLSVSALNSGLKFEDNDEAESSYDKNWFRNLYVYFLYYPFIDEFNTMSKEEMAEYESDENIVYSITAYKNDGTVVRYTYYKIDINFAFEKAEKGTVDENGVLTFEKPIYDFTAKMTQIRKVCKAIDLLLSGERVTPDDQIL